MNAKRIRNGRRLTALLLCLLLMLSGAPLQALAAEAQTDVLPVPTLQMQMLRLPMITIPEP